MHKCNEIDAQLHGQNTVDAAHGLAPQRLALNIVNCVDLWHNQTASSSKCVSQQRSRRYETQYTYKQVYNGLSVTLAGTDAEQASAVTALKALPQVICLPQPALCVPVCACCPPEHS